MEERNIDELISKYLAGEAGPEEALELEDWKELSPDNRAYYLECEKLFFEPADYVSIANTNVAKAFEAVKEKIGYTQKPTRIIPLRRNFSIAIAAAIVLIAGAAVVFNYWGAGGNATTTYTAMAAEKKVVLEDNSAVVLSPNSSFTVDDGFGKTNRTVKLKGSAYFEVTHTEKLPLTIDAGQVYIKDVGTKFRVTSSFTADTVTIKVDEGIVLVYDSAAVSFTLNAGEEVSYSKSQKKLVLPLTTKTVIHLAFSRQSLKEISQKLGEAYNTSIQLENNTLETCQLTVKFTGEDLETVLDIITETLGLTYIKTPDGYLIKGTHCND